MLIMLCMHLRKCAQTSNCLVGISPKGCTPLKDSKGVTFKSSRAAWEATFDAMAASNKRWEFAMHAHFGWCLKRFQVRCLNEPFSKATWPRQRFTCSDLQLQHSHVDRTVPSFLCAWFS
jgi:hypothetical protein